LSQKSSALVYILNLPIVSNYSATGFELSIQDMLESMQNIMKYMNEIISSLLLRVICENAFLLEKITFPLNGTFLLKGM
jgi:hypothetical protein